MFVALDRNQALFLSALDTVRGAKEAARIHLVRRYLGWDKKRFDEALTILRRYYCIDLHLGDPSIMSKEEVADCFIDVHGTLYISMSRHQRG